MKTTREIRINSTFWIVLEYLIHVVIQDIYSNNAFLKLGDKLNLLNHTAMFCKKANWKLHAPH